MSKGGKAVKSFLPRASEAKQLFPANNSQFRAIKMKVVQLLCELLKSSFGSFAENPNSLNKGSMHNKPLYKVQLFWQKRKGEGKEEVIH